MRRWLPLLCIAVFFIGLQLLLAEYRATFEFLQIAILAALLIALTAMSDLRKPNNMQGCMTILSMLYGPLLALLVALIELLARWPALDPVIGWSGAYRLPVLLFGIGMLLAIAGGIKAKLRRNKKLRLRHVLEALVSSALIGALASLIGFVWIGIGWGLNQAGL